MEIFMYVGIGVIIGFILYGIITMNQIENIKNDYYTEGYADGTRDAYLRDSNDEL